MCLHIIKKVMNEKKITQKELALYLQRMTGKKYSQSMISKRLKNGSMSFKELTYTARYIGITIEEILTNH